MATIIPSSDIIRIDSGIYVVDRTAEIIYGDKTIYNWLNDEGGDQWIVGETIEENGQLYHFVEQGVFRHNELHHYMPIGAGTLKIIYQIGGSLDGVKRIEVKPDEDGLEEKILCAINYWKKFPGENQQGIVYGLGLALEFFRVCKSKYKFTEWDAKMLLFKARSFTHQDESVDDLIQSALHRSIESLTITTDGERVTGEIKYKYEWVDSRSPESISVSRK